MRGHLIFFGYGYSARYLAPLLLKAGWTISATTRSTDPPKVEGVDFIQFNSLLDTDISRVSHILISVPPNETGDPVLNRHINLILGATNLRWVGYLSTTGVYGNTDGILVDETSPLNPSNARAKRRVAAESAWLNLYKNHNIPVHIFRLPGIYGPGRSSLDQVKAGRARRIEKPGHKFSRIHVADIAKVLGSSIKAPDPGAIYNVCDDEPAPQADVVTLACNLLGAPVPPLVKFDEAAKSLSPMARSFWNDNRLVDNSRIKNDLKVNLVYPTYRQGLRAIKHDEHS